MEAGGSSKKIKAKKICFNGLIDHLFSWTLEDILYDDFFRDKVQNIPESFKSVHQYLGSYLFPLLEETRAELSSSLKAIHRAPFARLVSIEEPKSSSKLLLNVNVDAWKNTTNNSGKEPYRTLPGDIFLLLDDKPETGMNLQCSTRTWAFAWVKKITDTGCSTHLKLNVSKNISGEHGMQKEFFIIFLMNVTTNLRIWNSLHFSEDVKIIKHVLSKTSMGGEFCSKCSLNNNVVCAEKLGTTLSFALNDSQKAAVLCSVCKTLCDHKPSVELIWGPPGTGKTKTISFLLWAILEMKQRVLACAPTNVAITELASRVVKLLRESSREGGVLCSLGDMLLFGNKDRLKVGSELEEIYLDYRVDRLLECFGQSGWKCHITSLIKLLEGSNSDSEYHMFLESNVNTSKRDKRTGDNVVEVTSFLGFIREKFNTIAAALRGCLQTLITHIPKQFILEHNFQNIEILLNLVDSFGMLLSQDNVTSKQMEILFSSIEVFMDFPNSSVEATFLNLRNQCLSILKFLQASLDQLQLPSTANKRSVKKFCFQRASLIFCTASSSFQLNSMKMNPVNLLVIDEAAQLKECESIVPLQLPGIKHAILIGDECQLPAIVSSQVCDAAGYGRSLFERLSLLGHSKHLLNTQYRMHPSISCFPNSKFYSNQILDAPLVMDKVHKKHYIPSPMFGPYTFINVSVGKEEGDDDGHSKKNAVEVAVVIKIIEKLYKAWRSAKTRLSIGVISFYAAQVSAIQGRLGQKYEKSDKFTVKVKSVDGFQGGEEDVIILSTVRSNRRKNIGFISNSQRINVALTRARHCLWIVGDATTLGNSNSEWEAVVSDAKDRQCYFNAEEDKDLADAIIEVKKVLLELDDLLNKDSVLFKMVQWKVLLSDSFRASFQKVVSINQKKSIIVLLLRLSCGWRPETNNVCSPKCSDIIKCIKVEGLFIIYSFDVEKDSKYKQVLKIWDIKPLTDVKGLVDCLSNIHELYTDDFLNLCKAKSQKGDLELPITWSASHDIVVYKDHMKAELDAILSLQADSDDTKNITLKKNLLQMKFQSLSYQKAKHLLSSHDSKELNLPCQVEDEQLEIILFPTSAFIMGRPGCGKTAALTIKLFMREQQQIHPGGCSEVTRQNAEVSYRNEGGEECKEIDRTVLRQLFITVTLKQCLAVKEHLSYLKRISNGGNILEENQSFNKVDVLDIDDAQDLLDVPNSFDGIPFNSYPLVVTFRKFLMMLDRTVGDSYLLRFQKQWKLSCGKPRDPLSTAAYNFIVSKEVTVKSFASSYWSYFSGHLTNKLDAVVVFNEIISQIKGGLGAKEALGGRLSKLDYIRRAKDQSTLSRKKREKIYDIFLDYEKMKKEKGEYDLADLVIDLHHRLKGFQYTGDQMDFVYVDEVQALTMMEIALLKYLCGNVSSGFVFSSNTAQTIAKGIDFRFQDIRFLFYKEFISRVKTDEKDIDAGLLKIPDILHMNQNCRTQPKILQLANSVTDLLFRFFPQCVDILCPETSEMSPGNFETPVLLENGKGQHMMTVLFEGRGNIPVDTREGGAKQVILVRDEHARNEISNLVGNQAIVLTIMECQSLEFQDVLLYNFFNSSPLGHQWRAIYQYMIEQDMLEIAYNSPNFNQPVRMDLCWELKLLHIAITRSRQRLWIYEDNQEFSNPMVDYWKKLCYIQVKTLDSSIIQAMKARGTKEEWSSLGLELFSEGVYGAASLCFERAEDRLRREWTRAASLRATAGILDGSNPQMACNVLRDAAEIYISVDRAEAAAKCFIELREYKTAAFIYLTKCGEAKLEDAGDCYMLAECYKLAAEAYSRGRCFVKFLNVCTVANLFDMGLQVICSWRECDDDDLIEKCQDIKEVWQVFLEKGALHYHELQDFRSMTKFVETFNSMDEKCSFLRTLGLSEKILLLEKDVEESINIMMKKGGILLEIDRFEKAGNFKDASSLILRHVFFSSLWGCAKKGWPLQSFKRKEKLLTRAKILAMKESDSFYDYVITEANILSNQTMTLFEMEQSWSSSHRHRNLRGEILSAWRILDAHLSSSALKYIWESQIGTNLREHVEQTISRNQVSVQTLAYFWNFWKENVMSILEYLQLPESQINGDYASYEQFCLDYLGVRKQFNYGNSIYHLVDPEAEWARAVSFEGNGNFVTINSRDFVTAAQSYWFSEISSVGLKVLSKLNDLHMLSVRSSLSFYFQAFTAVHIFQIAKFLTEDNCIKSSIDYKNQRTIFDSGHLSIQFLRLHQTPNVDLANEIEAVHDNSQSYLMSCALHFHKIQDSSTMLKFVRLKGDLLLEVDLLEKAGKLEEAVELILFYVLASSLWTTQSKGWPLKQFKQKEELLSKAKSIASLNSDVFHRNVCLETDILSDGIYSLLDMKHHLRSSRENKNICGEILSARRILDAHLCSNLSSYDWEDDIVSNPLSHAENKISQNQISIETLSHFWNLWKDNIIGIIKYLESLGTKNGEDFIIYEGFCLKYLGMRKQFDHQNTYQLLFTDADWITHINLHSVQTKGKLMSMDVQQFALAARSYWSTELLSVGMKVLEFLSNIHRFSVMHSFSKFRQSSATIRIVEIANFLLSSNLAKLPDDDKKLHAYLESYADHFFGNVFGACGTDPMTENMITLRESGLSKSVTEAFIVKTIDAKGQLSYEKIGKVVMALLGSGKLTSGLYDKIAGRCNAKLHWKAVIDALKRQVIASQTSENSVSRKVVEASGEGDLINQLHEALVLTFVNWKKDFDYMSPSCFLYIVERQFVLVSMSQGCFYTTRSSFIEWLICEEWPARQGQSMVNTEISSEHLFDSIAKMVHELLFNNCGAREWIKRSNINSKEFYPIFLLRLVIIMCLLSANLGKYCNMLYDFIRKPDMHSQLPEAFSKVFRQRKKQNLHFLNYMAEAVWKIRNPLVKVCFKGACKKPVAPAAISIRMKKIGKKGDIWKLLFAKNLMSFSPSGSKKTESINGSTLLNSKTSQVLHCANEDDNIDAVAIMIKQNSNLMFGSMNSETHTCMVNPKSSKSNALKRINLKKKVHCINPSVSKAKRTSSFDGETELFRVKGILDELRMSPAVNMSDPEIVTTIEELSRKLENGRQEKNTSNMVANTSQSKTKLSSASRRKRRTRRKREGKENEKMSVDNKMPKAKGSSQVLNLQPKFELETASHTNTKDKKKIIAKASSQGLQPKLKSVDKETTTQNDMKTEDLKKVAHIMSTTEGSSPGLQFQPKLESVHTEKTSQNATKIKDMMKVADNMLAAKGSSQGLKFQPKIELVWKEPTSQNATKAKDKMKVADNMSTAKGSSQGLQFQRELELKKVSQNVMKTKEKMKVANNMPTSKGSSQGLQFQPKNVLLCKEQASQNDSKMGDKVKVAHVQVVSTAEDSSNKLQFKQKLASAKKEIAAQNDVKTEKDTMNIVNKKAESAQKLQCKQNLKHIPKETTSSSNSEVKKDKMKVSNKLSEAKEPSQRLQLEQKKQKQKDVKAEKSKQKVAAHKFIPVAKHNEKN